MPFAACRNAGQPILAAAGFQPALGVSTFSSPANGQLVAPAVLPPVSSARFAVATLWDTLLLGGATSRRLSAGAWSFYIFKPR
jgi:hypothetical protein